MKLSPWTAHRIAFIAGEMPEERFLDDAARKTSSRRQRAVRVTVWECPHCLDRYDDEDDAEECCQGTEKTAPESPVFSQDVHCPVCGERHRDHHVAADCCLWRDIDAPTRWRIAARAEAARGEEMPAWRDAMRAEGVELP